ncbi:MAG: RcnB family protein [Pseudomonadota bacterium]
MTILNKMAFGLAATALSMAGLAQSAAADRKDRVERSVKSLLGGDKHNSRRGDRGQRGDRGDRGHRGDRVHADTRSHYNGGHYDRPRNYRPQRYHSHRGHGYRGHGYRGHHSGYNRHNVRRHHYNRHHYRPYYGYHSRPVYRHSRPAFSYGRYYNSHRYRNYVPRYRIGHHYGWHRGSVIIHDYGYHGLYSPPHGYHWVRDHDRGDAILASVATGAIIGLVIGALAN